MNFLFCNLPPLERSCRQPVLKQTVPVNQINALRIIRPSIAYRYRIRHLVAGDNHLFPFDDRIRRIEVIVRSRQLKTMDYAATFYDQPALDRIEPDADPVLPDAHRMV